MASQDLSASAPSTSNLRSAAAAAALLRIAERPSDEDDDVQFAKEREDRQNFRRLVDPGIVRHNPENIANACVDCLLTLCQNILNNPDDEKYRKFKTTNKRIQAGIIDPKGGLEYATAVGFREHMESFQPYYLWRPTPENFSLLRIGTFVLQEHKAKVMAKEEQSKVKKPTKEQINAEIAAKVKLAYEDDRKARALRDKLEKQRRQALQEATEQAQQQASLAEASRQSASDPTELKED
ncbi:hypothetical protein FRB99_005543 [Tulasnella sp. 403]|nr:hypothetical protein FRB99_005543 [Tulasnella sp. 403]